MTKKLTAEEKIRKILKYCKKVKDKAKYCKDTVGFKIECEITGGETETEVSLRGSKYTHCFAKIGMLLYALKAILKDVQRESRYFNNLFAVRVWIKTFHSSGLVDEEAINKYEITFRGGVEL